MSRQASRKGVFVRQAVSLSHTRWECEYHVVFVPKYRRRVLFGRIRQELGPVFRQLAEQKESLIEEGHLMPDPVHRIISIPPKYSVSQVINYIKGKSTILRGRIGSVAAMTRDSTFGHAVILHQQSVNGEQVIQRVYTQSRAGRSGIDQLRLV